MEEAVTTYEVAVVEDPSEPEPYFRIARIFRDELKDPDAAARWFSRARTGTTLSSGQEMQVPRETAEDFPRRFRDRRWVAPEFARLADGLLGTPHGDWAARELKGRWSPEP